MPTSDTTPASSQRPLSKRRQNATVDPPAEQQVSQPPAKKTRGTPRIAGGGGPAVRGRGGAAVSVRGGTSLSGRGGVAADGGRDSARPGRGGGAAGRGRGGVAGRGGRGGATAANTGGMTGRPETAAECERGSTSARSSTADSSYNHFDDINTARPWMPSTLRQQHVIDPALSSGDVATHAREYDELADEGFSRQTDDDDGQMIDKDALIAQLRGQMAAMKNRGRAADQAREEAERGRVAAERHAAELQRRARETRLNEMAKRMAPIPRPSRSRNAKWSWAKMERILGLPPPSKGTDPTLTEQARIVIYHWILHTSRLVLYKAHRELGVDIGASFQKLLRGTKKNMLELFRIEVKRYAFLWPVFFHTGPESKAGTSKFKNEWIMKELLKRTMKNERDGLKRPKTYARQARALLAAARDAGEQTSVLEAPIVRLDSNGMALANLYEEAHQSDNGEDDDDEDEDGSSRRRGDLSNEVLTERQKEQLEKEAREKQLLTVDDASWYNLDEDAQAALLAERQEADAPDVDLGAPEI